MKTFIALVAAAGIAIAAPVAAQTAANPHAGQGGPAAAGKPGQPGRPGMGRQGMGGQGMGGMMQQGGMHGMHMVPARHLEGRLAFLRAEIGITDAQAPVWNGFADAVRKASKERMAAMPPVGQQPPAEAGWLANLERHEKMMAAHLESLRAIRTAAQPLYAALSDEQKKTADELMKGPMGPMGGPMGGGPMGGMGRM